MCCTKQSFKKGTKCYVVDLTTGNVIIPARPVSKLYDKPSGTIHVYAGDSGFSVQMQKGWCLFTTYEDDTEEKLEDDLAVEDYGIKCIGCKKPFTSHNVEDCLHTTAKIKGDVNGHIHICKTCYERVGISTPDLTNFILEMSKN